MNVLLVDHLACPRCGPTFGLVLLAREVRNRRVRRGELGCPNCRDAFPVECGFADLRPPPRTPLWPGTPPRPAAQSGGSGPAASDGPASGDGRAQRALRLGAALNVGGATGATGGQAGVYLVTEGCREAAVPLARLVPGIEVVALGRCRAEVAAGTEPSSDGAAAAVSAMATGAVLPLRDGAARGVALAGSDWKGRWREAVRVTASGGRIAVAEAPQGARKALEGAGLATVFDGDGWLVAQCTRPAGSRRSPG